MTWQANRTMTGPEFAALVRRLGMQQHHAAKWLGITERTARRYVLEDTPVPAAIVLLMRAMAHHREQPLVPQTANALTKTHPNAHVARTVQRPSP